MQGRKRSKDNTNQNGNDEGDASKRAKYSHGTVTTGGDLGPTQNPRSRPLVTTLGSAGSTRVALCEGTQQYKIRKCAGITLREGVDSHSRTLPMRRNQLISAACLDMNAASAESIRSMYDRLNICEAPISMNARRMWESHFARHTLAYLSRLYDGAILPCILEAWPVPKDPAKHSKRHMPLEWKKDETWSGYTVKSKFKSIFDDLQGYDDDPETIVKHASGPLPAPFTVHDEFEMFKAMRDMDKTTYVLYVVIKSPYKNRAGHAVLLIFQKKLNSKRINVSYLDPNMGSKHDSFFTYMAHKLCWGFAGGGFDNVYYAGPAASYKPHLKYIAKNSDMDETPMFARGFQAANSAAPHDELLDPWGFCTVWSLLIAEYLVSRSGGGRLVIDTSSTLEHFARGIGPEPARWRKLALDYMFSRAVDIHAWATKYSPRYSSANVFRRVMAGPYVASIKPFEVIGRIRQYIRGWRMDELHVGRGFSYMR